MKNLTRPLPVLFLLSLLATLIYSNTFSVPFHFDDIGNIVDNSRIRHLNFLELSNSRYVGFLTFALNYQLGAVRVFGYHLVNLLIHIANGFLVYSLVSLLFRVVQQPPNPLIALATALLFVAHPIQTQAVTYIVQRFTSLATLFYLLGVIGYFKWRLENKFLWYGAALISTVLGMKTKENVFTLPLMIVLIEFIFFTGKRWKALIPFLLALAIIPLSRFEVLGESDQLVSETTSISRSDYLFTQFRVMVTYLRLLVLPVVQNLDYDYPRYSSLFVAPVFLSFLFLSSLFATAVYLLRCTARQPSSVNPQLKLIAFGIFWFFLTLSVESSIIPIRDVMYEHRVYLPSVGVFLAACVAWNLVRPKTFWSFGGLLPIGVIIAIFSVAAHQRNIVWKDDLSLWQDVVKKSPNKARGYDNLVLAYQGKGMMGAAMEAVKTSLRLQPDYHKTHNNLGSLLVEQGQLEGGIQEYRTALRLQPDYTEAYYNLGIALAQQGKLEEAIEQYRESLKLRPDFAMAHNGLGDVYVVQGRFEEAIDAFQAALKFRPDYARAHHNLGHVYVRQKRYEEAIRSFQASLKFQPNLVKALYNLGNIYVLQGRYPEAIREYRTALRYQPDDVEVHNNLGNTYLVQGNPEEAIREYRIILKYRPNSAEAYSNLGSAYQKQGQVNKAIEAFEQALRIKPDFPQARRALGELKKAPPP